MEPQTSLGKNISLIITLVALSCVLILLNQSNFLIFIRGGVEFLINPVQKQLIHVKVRAAENIKIISDLKQQQIKIRTLQDQIILLDQENASLRYLKDENNILKEQINAVEPTKYKLLPANTLGISQGTTMDVDKVVSTDKRMSIDKGSIDGIKVGQTVIVKNVLIGKVVWTGLRSSKIRLTTDPESKISVEILTDSKKAKGIAYGDFRSGILLNQVLQEEKISPGDLITTSGEDDGYPKGLLVGKVNSIEKKDADFFQKASVTLFIEPKTVDMVFVII